MDIASLSVSYNQFSTMQDFSVAMLGKQLDTYETQGAEMVKAMEQSVNPSIGANIDIRV
jgi:hypothetical protein